MNFTRVLSCLFRLFQKGVPLSRRLFPGLFLSVGMLLFATFFIFVAMPLLATFFIFVVMPLLATFFIFVVMPLLATFHHAAMPLFTVTLLFGGALLFLAVSPFHRDHGQQQSAAEKHQL
ncbi:hypothetical protein F3A81_24670 [Salmonella enterica subsp. enterica serovar Typhi]|nr:hypothetical protein [Salmonella enterica subsp. enterica serovar Typhi]